MFVKPLRTLLVLLFSVGLLVGGTGVLLSQGGGTPVPERLVPFAEPAPPPKGEWDPTVPRSRRVHKALAAVVDFGPLKANTHLKDALKQISDNHNLSIEIDHKAFEAIGVVQIEQYGVELPRMCGVGLSTVLTKLLKQVRGDVYHGTYQVRSDHVEVTTWYNQVVECRADPPDHPGLRGAGAEPTMPAEMWGDWTRKVTPVVHLDSDDRPLIEALRDLEEDAGFEILIDRRAADKAKTRVTLTLNNALFDTAVNLLVEQADLDWMWLDNIVYVGTRDDIKARKDRKRALEQEKVKMLRDIPAMPAGLGPALVPGLLPPGPAPLGPPPPVPARP